MEHCLWIILAALFTGLIDGDKISPVRDEVSGTEGQPVTLRCDYETTYEGVYLHWYRHQSDLQAPQFILWKGARSRSDSKYIPNGRYESETSRSSTELTIKELTLADTALYYCALDTQ
ncbi:T cell receptor delta [Xyrichtys novacula]|nr:T cell receptor delta [Xyrichtys novacula]